MAFQRIPRTAGFCLALASLVSPACGRGGSSHDKGDSSPVPPASTVDPAAAAANPTEPKSADVAAEAVQSFAFTAEYKPRAVDVVVIVDGNARSNGYFAPRLTAALPLLSARLWNLASTVGSVHVAVLDHFFFDNNLKDDIVPPNPAAPLVDPSSKDKVLKVEAMDSAAFDAAFEARFALTGNRGGTPAPASVLAAVATEAAKAKDSEVDGLLRKDAFLAVLMVGGSLNPSDALDASDVLAAYSGKAGNMAISTLAPDKAGCTIADSDPPVETNPTKAPQRNLEIKLQEATGGIFGSVCEKTYTLFMDDFVTKATGTEFFPITLPAGIDSVVQIATDSGVEIKDYRFVKGAPVIEVSTRIAPGAKFSVKAVLVGSAPKTVASASEGDDVPQAGEGELSPAETAFLKDVQPKLNASCGGCHAGRPFDPAGGFLGSQTYKAEIARRLELPATDPQFMPKGGTLSVDDKAALLGWATK